MNGIAKHVTGLCLVGLFFFVKTAAAFDEDSPRDDRGGFEWWQVIETRLPLSGEAGWVPKTLRFATEIQSALLYPGIGQFSLRLGPMWEFSPSFFTGLNFNTIAYQVSPGNFSQEYRVELEPTFRLALHETISVTNRNRFEARFRSDRTLWRYRNQSRLNWQLPGFPATAYVSEEMFFDLTRDGLNQNRTTLGLSWKLTSAIRLDTGYMLRFRKAENNSWVHDHIVLLNLFYASDSDPILPMSLSN